MTFKELLVSAFEKAKVKHIHLREMDSNLEAEVTIENIEIEMGLNEEDLNKLHPQKQMEITIEYVSYIIEGE